MYLEALRRIRARIERHEAAEWFGKLSDEEFDKLSDLKKTYQNKYYAGYRVSWRKLREFMQQEAPEAF